MGTYTWASWIALRPPNRSRILMYSSKERKWKKINNNQNSIKFVVTSRPLIRTRTREHTRSNHNLGRILCLMFLVGSNHAGRSSPSFLLPFLWEDRRRRRLRHGMGSVSSFVSVPIPANATKAEEWKRGRLLSSTRCATSRAGAPLLSAVAARVYFARRNRTRCAVRHEAFSPTSWQRRARRWHGDSGRMQAGGDGDKDDDDGVRLGWSSSPPFSSPVAGMSRLLRMDGVDGALEPLRCPWDVYFLFF